MSPKRPGSHNENASIIHGLMTALRFLTIFPVPSWGGEGKDAFEKSLVWFPAVGVIIGSVLWGVSYLTVPFPVSVSSVVIIFLMGFSSGFLHLDGLADTADGFLSSRPKDKMLEIMRDSHVGAMGVLILLFIILLKILCLAQLSGDYFLKAVLLAPIAGRCSILLQMASLKYARSTDGLGRLFYADKLLIKSILSSLFFIGIACLAVPNQAAWVILFFFGINIVHILTCKNKIGGATGDTLGAGCELTEAAILMSFTLSI